MAYIIYDKFLNIYKWRDKDGTNYIPFSDESPDYYVVDGVRYLTKSTLTKQGLKTKHLKALGEPDLKLPNRRYPGNGYMLLYKETRVDALLES